MELQKLVRAEHYPHGASFKIRKYVRGDLEFLQIRSQGVAVVASGEKGEQEEADFCTFWNACDSMFLP